MAQDDDRMVRIGRSSDGDRAMRALVSGRIGLHGGRAARTYHCNFTGVKAGVGSSAVDYLARQEDYEDRDDLEHLEGDTKSFKDAVAEIDKTARVRTGRTAETVMKTVVFELPADSTPETRLETAKAVIEAYAKRGYPSIAAVHYPKDGQPHIHVAVASRPVAKTQDGYTVDRTPGRVIAQTKKALMAERSIIASMVNETCRQSVLFHPGRDATMDQPGIKARKPKHRLPERDYCVDHVRESSPTVVAELRARHQVRRKAARERAVIKTAEETARRSARIVRWGLVPADKLIAAEDRAERAEQAVKLATEGQRRMISGIVGKLGLTLPDGWQERLSGNDIVAAVRSAERGKMDDYRQRIAALEAKYETGPPRLVETWREATAAKAAWPDQRWSDGYTNAGALEWARKIVSEPIITPSSADELFTRRRTELEQELPEARAQNKSAQDAVLASDEHKAEVAKRLVQVKAEAANFGLTGLWRSDKAGRAWAEAEAARIAKESATQIKNREVAAKVMAAHQAVSDRVTRATAELVANTAARRIAIEAGLQVPGLGPVRSPLVSEIRRDGVTQPKTPEPTPTRPGGRGGGRGRGD